jgi:hypothetical protein
MKAIKRLFISLVVIVAVLGVVVIGGYIYVRSAYGIDLFRTAGQLKTLTEQVNEAELCPNAYGDSDFTDLKNSVNAEIEGLVKFEEGKGYNGYTIDFNALIGAELSKTIALSEKQVGALAQTVFFEQTGGKIQLGGKQTDVTIVQTDFSEIAEDGSADFNVVAKIDLTPFKADMGDFPYKYFKKYIPDNLYVSSTVRVDKTGDGGFGYTLSHKSITLNNLNAEETEDLFHTLDAVLKIGNAESVNLQIGTIAVNALIGNEENVGFAYSLKAVGATQFNFENVITDENSVDLFSVK